MLIKQKKISNQTIIYIICMIVVLLAEILTLFLKGKTLNDTIASMYGVFIAISYVAEIIGFIALITMILYDQTYHIFENLTVKKVLWTFYISVGANFFLMMLRMINYHMFFTIINIVVSLIVLYSVYWLEFKNHHKYDDK